MPQRADGQNALGSCGARIQPSQRLRECRRGLLDYAKDRLGALIGSQETIFRGPPWKSDAGFARPRDLSGMDQGSTWVWEAEDGQPAESCGFNVSGQVTESSPVARAGPLRRGLTRYFSHRVPDPAEVEDLVQEVFARLSARDSREPIEHLSGFVFQVASNVLADRGRRRFARKAEAHVEFDPERHADEDFDPYRILAGKETLRAVTQALLSLPHRTRTVFVLHRLEGRKSRDVAAQLGISVSAVEKHMVRAVQHISQVRGRAT
jgi:RNA polymerase sigma factor (sigma-70 family)